MKRKQQRVKVDRLNNANRELTKPELERVRGGKPAGSGAAGLIQFVPKTARSLGTATEDSSGPIEISGDSTGT
ncbi:MAG TPA: hypothetical protein VFC63_07895 [Blastocatellia bacterium]|nr:hypothetical protein [Blastocatellia bacterium]